MISLDSRTKKPKLWSLLVLSLAMIPVLLILYRTGTAGGTQEIQLCTVRSASVLLCLYYMAALFLLGNAFRKQLEYNPYSYNIIYYSGFFLFVFFLLEVQLFLMLHSFTEPGRYGTWDALMSSFLYSARTFVILSLPFLLTFCADALQYDVARVSLLLLVGKLKHNLSFVNILYHKSGNRHSKDTGYMAQRAVYLHLFGKFRCFLLADATVCSASGGFA